MSAAASPSRFARSNRERTLVTSEGIALPLTVASRGTRFGALAIDLTIVSIVMFAVELVFQLTGLRAALSSGEEGGDPARALEFLGALYIVAMFLFHYGYFLYFELGPRGATPGKRLTGIRIAARPNSSGGAGRLSAEMVIARNLLRDIELFLPALFFSSGDWVVISIVTVLWLLVFVLFPFYNKDRLRAGDLIAGTWVVEAPKRKLEAAMSQVVAPAMAHEHTYEFRDEDLAAYGEYELQTLERVLREGRSEAMEAVAEAICRKIGWTPPAQGGERAFLEAYYTQLRARLETGMRFGKRKADKHE